MLNLVIGSIRENRIVFLAHATLLSAKHFITLGPIVFILLLPPLVFLLVVPGGEGLHLSILSRVLGCRFL